MLRLHYSRVCVFWDGRQTRDMTHISTTSICVFMSAVIGHVKIFYLRLPFTCLGFLNTNRSKNLMSVKSCRGSPVYWMCSPWSHTIKKWQKIIIKCVLIKTIYDHIDYDITSWKYPPARWFLRTEQQRGGNDQRATRKTYIVKKGNADITRFSFKYELNDSFY